MATNPISKTVECIKDYGFLETFLKMLHRLRVISVLHTFEIVFKDLTVENGGINQISENRKITMREIKEHELDQLKFAPGMYTLETFRMHFSKGMRFCAAFLEGEVVAINGIHMTCADLVYIGMPNILLPAKVAYLNCAHTAPAYRDLSIGTQLRDFRLDLVRQEGVEQVFGAVFIQNKKALRWNLRNGFQYWGRISYIQLLNQKFWIRRLSSVGKRHAYILNGTQMKNEPQSLMKAS